MASYNGGSVTAHIGADISDYKTAMKGVAAITTSTMSAVATSSTKAGVAIDGAFQDKNGRWRAANGRFLTTQEKLKTLGQEAESSGKNADNAGQRFGGMTSSVMKIAAGVGAVTLVSKGIGVLKDSVGSAVARFDTLNAYPKVMKQMGYSTQDTNKSVGILKKGVDGLPTSLQDLTQSAQSFAILEKSATKGAQTATALNDAFLASGASAGDASRGVEQYSQMLASGSVDLQSWKTLQETMPYALTTVAKSFGLTGKSAERDLYAKLKSGDITMDQLNKRFVELDGGMNGFANTARTATGGIGTSFTNMKNAVTNGLANTITAVDNGLKSAGITNGIAGIFNQAKQIIVTSFAAINGVIQGAMPVMVRIFNTIAPTVSSAFNTVTTIISGTINFVKANSGWLEPLVVGIATFAGAIVTINTLGRAFTVLKVASAVGGDIKLLGFALNNMASSSKLAQAGLMLYNGVTKVAMGAQAAFNAVMAINPFVLIIAAVVTLVAGITWWITQTKSGQAVWQAFTTW
ncbi:tape measure protein, partial [Periweissella ghanensis]|uniref:tape measure protein n=1 Tax=Periweissella ghanensis TaxID=467997 RepID=UPI00202EDBC2